MLESKVNAFNTVHQQPAKLSANKSLNLLVQESSCHERELKWPIVYITDFRISSNEVLNPLNEVRLPMTKHPALRQLKFPSHRGQIGQVGLRFPKDRVTGPAII